MRTRSGRNAVQRGIAWVGATVVAVGLLAAAAPAANAAAPPTMTVGANVNLSTGLGNQFEASVAIDPTNPSRLFVLGRDETGNLIGARSSDGGTTWTHSKMGTSQFSVDKLPAAWGNTSVAFDGFGNLFVVYLGPIPQTYATFALSTDGGATFSHQTALANLTDQPVVAVGSGSVWVTYNRGGVNVAVGAAVTGLGVMGAFGPTEVIAGANGGAFGDLAVGPNGEVMAAFGPLGAAGDVIVSVDPDGLGPAGFTAAAAATTTNVGGFTYLPVAPNWGIDSEAHLAWDHSGGVHNGRVYLAYLDSSIADPVNTDLLVTHSDDVGLTWSTPVLVNDDGSNASQVMPGFAIDQTTGNVAATWYDTRGDATRAAVHYYGSVSGDGGATWSPNVAISAGGSDQAGATPPGGIRDTDFGDYTGLAFHDGVMVPVWADNSNSTGDNPAGAGAAFDLYTALVTVTVPSTTVVAVSSSVAAPASGQPTKLTAVVTSPVTGTKKVNVGTVDFFDGGGLLGSATVHSGKAALTRSFGAGTHSIVATYNGAGAVESATSAALGLVVAPATTAVVLHGPASRVAGAPAMFKVTVKTVAPAKGVATGTATFLDGATVLAIVALDIAGRATFTTSSLATGAHTITANYDGDANHAPSTASGPITIR